MLAFLHLNTLNVRDWFGCIGISGKNFSRDPHRSEFIDKSPEPNPRDVWL
jgi:hypothetical protein